MANKIFVEPKQSPDGTVVGFWALIAIDNGDGTYSLFIKDQATSGAPAIAAAISSSGASPVVAGAAGGITGAGTAGRIPRFTAASVIADSLFSQSMVVIIFLVGTLNVLNVFGLEVVQVSGLVDMIGGTMRLGANGRMPGVPVPYDPTTPMPGEFYVQHFAGLSDFYVWQLGGLLQDGSGSRLVQASLVMDNTNGASNPTQGYLRLSASAAGKAAAYQKCGLDFNHIGIIQVLTAGVFQFTDVSESGAARLVLGPATAGFPCLAKDPAGVGFIVRLGDDTADAPVRASSLVASALNPLLGVQFGVGAQTGIAASQAAVGAGGDVIRAMLNGVARFLVTQANLQGKFANGTLPSFALSTDDNTNGLFIRSASQGVIGISDILGAELVRLVFGLSPVNTNPAFSFSGLTIRATNGDNSADIAFAALSLAASGLTANSFLYSGVGGLLTSTAAPTNGQLLIGSTGAAPAKANLTSVDGSVVITNGAGSIDLSAPGGAVASIGARVNKSAAQAVADSTVVAVAFDQEQFDDGGCHDNAVNNSRLTVPAGKGGVYTISAAVRWAANALGRRILSIRLNGATTVGSVEQPVSDGANEARQTCSAIFRFVAGDFIEVTVFQNTGGNLNITNTSDGSWFAMERIAA